MGSGAIAGQALAGIDQEVVGPLLLSRHEDLLSDGELAATDVHDVILRHLGVPVRETAAR